MRPTSKTKDLYDVANFNDQTAMLNLADPTVSSIDVSRINNNGSFAYVLQRGGVTRMLNGIVHDWAEGSYQGLTKTLIGFRRAGKSYALAAWVCWMRKRNWLVLYTHNVANMINYGPFRFFKREPLAAFHGDDEMQNKIWACTGVDARRETDCCRRSWSSLLQHLSSKLANSNSTDPGIVGR